MAAVATAWGSFQAAKGDGRQSILYAEAGVDQVQATTVAIAGQRLASDASTFNQWLAAKRQRCPASGDAGAPVQPGIPDGVRGLAEDGTVHHAVGPAGPAYLPEYHNPQLEQAKHLNEEAAATEAAGTHARETAERYIGATVLFALVLFLVAVGQRFRILGVRIGAIAMAVVLLGYALFEVATLPRL